MIRRLDILVFALATCFGSGAVTAQMAHEHRHEPETCSDLSLACASTATPAFGPDGALWIAARVKNQIFVTKSRDHGRSFTPPVVVTQPSINLDTGPDAGPKMAVGRDGRTILAYAALRDKKYNGEVFYTRSADDGQTFSPPAPITSDPESQRFAALAIDSDGSIFSAWLDKRNRAQAKDGGAAYVGAAVAFAWSRDDGSHFAQARLAHDGTCECCRIGVGFAATGRPVVLFRNIFEGSTRDHAVLTFSDPETPGPVFRVSDDDWETNACPHQGPSLSVSPDGAYHAVWFTAGRARKGLFYARSLDGGRSFSNPKQIGDPDRAPSRPDILSVDGKLWLAWKEFDGERTSVLVMSSDDNGENWSRPKAIAATTEESDHPRLISDGRRAYLSWQTIREGYHLIALDDAT